MTSFSRHETGPSGASRADAECARTYGAEARQHHFDRDWDEVKSALAAGWTRVRGGAEADWPTIAPEVYAGWQSAAARASHS